MKTGTNKKNLLALGFIALLGLATLFLITNMIQTTGDFVYAGGLVQLDPTEACTQITNCQKGPAIFITSTGWKYNTQPGQYAICICPENVYTWQQKTPLNYDRSQIKIIPLVQNYETFLQKKQEGQQLD